VACVSILGALRVVIARADAEAVRRHAVETLPLLMDHVRWGVGEVFSKGRDADPGHCIAALGMVCGSCLCIRSLASALDASTGGLVIEKALQHIDAWGWKAVDAPVVAAVLRLLDPQSGSRSRSTGQGRARGRIAEGTDVGWEETLSKGALAVWGIDGKVASHGGTTATKNTSHRSRAGPGDII